MSNAATNMAVSLLVVTVLVGGCGDAHRLDSARMGAVYTAKPAPCGVRFENLNHQEASAKFDMIGLITVSNMSSSALTEAVKRDVEREACNLGADAVTLNVGTGNVLQFAAWHSK